MAVKMKIVSSAQSTTPPEAEHELSAWVDLYLRDELDEARRERFEQALISDQSLQELTRQAYVLGELSREFPEQLSAMHRVSRRPIFAYAMAASLGAALVALPAWWVQQELRQQQGQLAQQLEQVQATLAAVAAPQAGLAVLRLGATRSSRSADGLLRQAPEVRWAQLVLPMSAPDGDDWPADAQLEFRGLAGGSVTRYPLSALAGHDGPTLLVPVAAMPAGDYKVSVINHDEVLSEYRFELQSEVTQSE